MSKILDFPGTVFLIPTLPAGSPDKLISMLKRWITVSLLGLLFVGLILGVTVHLQCGLLQPTLQCRTFPVSDSKGINVLVLGDSWATHPQLAESIRTELSASVRSSGHSGATSKAVYTTVFGKTGCNNDSDLFTGVNYAIVIVGVNDAQSHRGSDFYAHHVLLLSSSLRSRGIEPIVVLLPRFGITEASQFKPWYLNAKHGFFHLVVDRHRTDTITDYRAELQRRRETSAVLFDPDSAIGTYSPINPLWRDPLHLSPLGDQVLGRAAAQVIIHEIHHN